MRSGSFVVRKAAQRRFTIAHRRQIKRTAAIAAALCILLGSTVYVAWQ